MASGQFYFGTDNEVVGGTVNNRIVRVNDDGTGTTTIKTEADDTADGLRSNTVWDIGVDTALGLYFSIVGDPSSTKGYLVRGTLAGGAQNVVARYDNNTPTNFNDDPYVSGLVVDSVARRIYVGVQDFGYTASGGGIRQYSYDAAGNVTDLGFLVTTGQTNKASLSGSHRYAAAGNNNIFSVFDFDFVKATNKFYFTELETNSIFSFDADTPTVVTRLLSQTQFPLTLAAGELNDVEVDTVNGRIFFTTHADQQNGSLRNQAYTGSGVDGIWVLADNGTTDQTATRVNIVGLPAGTVVYFTDMVFDQANNRLYVDSDGRNNTDTDDVVYVFNLSGTGTNVTATLFQTLTTGYSVGNVGGMAFNELPTLAAIGRTTAASEQVAAVAVFSTAPTIGEPGGYLTGATIQITGNLTTGDVLSLASGATTGTSITAGSYNPATGTITLTGTDTIARYQTVLNNLLYNTTSDNPTNYGAAANRTVTITLNDGSAGVPAGSSNTSTVSFAVNGVNDAPVTTPGGPASGNEDAGPILLSGISVFDVDTSPTAQNVTVTLAVNGGGALTVSTSVGGGIGAGGVSGNNSPSVTLTGTQSQINATLASAGGLTFAPTLNFNGVVTLTVTTNDGGLNGTGGALTGSATKTITVASVNDAPLFAAAGAAASYTENAPAVQIASGVTLSDVENDSFQSLSVSITGNLVTGDRLSLPSTGNVVVDTGTGAVTVGGFNIGTVTALGTSSATVTFNANATAARVVALTEAVGFLSLSDDPTAVTRQVTFTLIDSGGNANGGNPTTTFLRNVAVTPVDDPRTATADTASTAETTAVAGNVLTNDNDPDAGPASTVGAVNGVTGNVGTTVALSSGARVFVAANGSYTYDPNGAFNYLVAPGSPTGGQSSATDSFTYTVTGGATATVTVTITGVTNAGDQIRGSAGNNTLNGTTAADYFDISQGGDDSVNANDGDDLIFAGGGFNSGDTVSGGIGTDQFGLRGSFTGSLGNVTNTEALIVLSGTSTRFGGDGTARYTYDLTTSDATVAAGVAYVVQANELVAGENMRFDGAAETNGSFRIYAGQGVDTLIGGAGDDGFFFGEGGRFTTLDIVNGGAGNDQLALRGNYTVALAATTVTNVETIVLLSAQDAPVGVRDGGRSAYTYDLTLANATVASGQTLTVNAAQLRSTESARIDGFADTDGILMLIGGQGADELIGGGGADTLFGGLGADSLTGEGGNDRFVYTSVAESGTAVGTRDTIHDLRVGDLIDLSAIDAVSGGVDNAFTFTASLPFGGIAGQLRVTLVSTGVFLVEGDVDGVNGADFAITVQSDHNLTAADFIL